MGILTRPTADGLRNELKALNERWKTEGYARAMLPKPFYEEPLREAEKKDKTQ